ncbi:MAG: hypothetical protein KKB30_11805 [Proteobacteria bacterium]|nr:hypothetical protein [Pseudomonadota bacterium]MBU1714398.1 hypothetical protein [Pseudomonadota bacterium]
MSEITDQEKLRVLLPHWLAHNDSHIAEFSKWEVVARAELGEEVADLIKLAICGMTETGEALVKALEKIGGPPAGHHHHHHNHG